MVLHFDPVVALFLSLSLGYLVGLIRIGPIQIGGISGTLFVALLIGQTGVTIGADLKNTAFALFIYALGFTAGPQFFTNIRSGWRYGILSIVEVVSVLGLVVLAVLLLHFDVGTAAGLFAGAATESAVIGTASEAVSNLNLPAAEIERLQANIASAYSVTYLFGLIAIVVFTAQVAPLLLRINLRDEAKALAQKLGSEEEDFEPGLPNVVGRAFKVGGIAGSSVGEFERSRNYVVTIGRVKRGRDLLEAEPELVLQPDDVVFIIGRRNAMIAAQERLGDEVPVPPSINVPMVSRDVVLVRPEAAGHTINEIRRMARADLRRGIFISSIVRLGNSVPALPRTRLEQGDILTLYGAERAIAQALPELGNPLERTDKTDFIFLGLGIVVGLLVGKLGLRIGALDLTLGTGGGALVSGLLFGWLHSRRPHHGTIPVAAAEFMKDFGLATFITAVGLSAGPEFIALIERYGLLLPILGIIVSAAPAALSLFIGHKLLKIEPPILLGAIAGQHCSTPTLSALVNSAGNSTPVIGYTVTYAISNVLLPLMGPVVVGITAALT